MIKLIIKGKVCNSFDCILENESHARELLNMLSVIDADDTYAPKSINVETDIVHFIGREYKVIDNSYIINLETQESAYLMQEKSGCYSPDKKEDGAKFIIVSRPYVERDTDFFKHYHIFVNVRSKKTNEIYRVLFYENGVGKINNETNIKRYIITYICQQ